MEQLFVYMPWLMDVCSLSSFAAQDQEDGPLYRFYNKIRDEGGDFMQEITKMKDVTLFAPSNMAWAAANIDKLYNREKLRDILNLHLVRERLSIETIVEQNMNQVPTAAERKKLYFNVINNGFNTTLTVEGGGVNATVLQPNIAATNGFVHIIDRVLGVPYTNVKEKLESDPMLKHLHIQVSTNCIVEMCQSPILLKDEIVIEILSKLRHKPLLQHVQI
ncbi:beta subunit of fatty acid synthetase [Periplaneta americana]|uniref:Beta subunit of fatty acid synthetase n=1 Tax=Periplaneta americana TaxID=6978 RepID=A0ABQ8TZ75_PERAM|nr:beta subunit of fatty acid synthetase [Periplaneta americana]